MNPLVPSAWEVVAFIVFALLAGLVVGAIVISIRQRRRRDDGRPPAAQHDLSQREDDATPPDRKA
ncbi:hypothetical protein [Gordonia caeni]|uniref:hypothetical protein n=1 Tax=Gordonia caeni TaxID=1007097 RepID=UPI0031D2B295